MPLVVWVAALLSASILLACSGPIVRHWEAVAPPAPTYAQLFGRVHGTLIVAVFVLAAAGIVAGLVSLLAGGDPLWLLLGCGALLSGTVLLVSARRNGLW